MRVFARWQRKKEPKRVRLGDISQEVLLTFKEQCGCGPILVWFEHLLRLNEGLYVSRVRVIEALLVHAFHAMYVCEEHAEQVSVSPCLLSRISKIGILFYDDPGATATWTECKHTSYDLFCQVVYQIQKNSRIMEKDGKRYIGNLEICPDTYRTYAPKPKKCS